MIRFALKFVRRLLLNGGRLDATVIAYLINILGALLRVVLVVAILGFFGIQTASFAALLAGAGVGSAWLGAACSPTSLLVFLCRSSGPSVWEISWIPMQINAISAAC